MRRAPVPVTLIVIGWLASGVARAQAPDADAELLRRVPFPDATAWWSADGRAGWAPDMEWLGVSYPWVLGGLVRGGWSLDETNRMPAVHAGPGVQAAHAPLVWFDSLDVRETGGTAAWQGFDGAMVPVSGRVFGTERATNRGTRVVSMFSFARGSSAAEENTLALARTDSLSSFRYEVVSGQRGAVGPYEDAGAHRYGLSGRIDRGSQRFEARFAHRGEAMAITGGAAGENAMGAGGAVAWSLRRPEDVVRLELRRATDWHESDGWAIGPSRRDQDDDGAEVTWLHGAANQGFDVRATGWKTHVRRDQDSLGVGTEDDRASGWWTAVRGARPWGALAADATLGLGAQEATGGLVTAPSAGLAVGRGPVRGQLRIERVVTPVWSDLAPGVTPFLQDTWTGAMTLAAGDSARHVRVTGRVGHTRNRAVAQRWPLEELWLRFGYRMDPDPYRFALVSFESGWAGRHWGTTLEAFALAHSYNAIQSSVDPVNGVRASIDAGGHLFKNELGVRLRLTGALVGARQSEATGAWFDPYVTVNAAGVFTLSDATLVIEGLGIENHPEPLTWIDPRTGQDALGAGLESRVSFSWRLFN
jgi:hypothetical protein